MGVDMAGQRNAAPVLIRRKKVINGGGHHGGAWKVAYADFVTAMMAFFLLMWLLNATTEKQRKGLADYFNPTIAVSRMSSGGEGVLSGDSILAADVLAHNGTGAPDSLQSTKAASGAEDAELAAMEQKLLARFGESMVSDRLRRHIITRLSDEGLVIELFDTPEATLFTPDADEPMPVLQELTRIVAEVAALAINPIAVSGHVKTYPVTLRRDPVWDLSTSRAEVMRGLLVTAGIDQSRMQRVTGYADRRPATVDPTAIRNNRVEVVLLRRRPE